jgi:hypothetical protein
MKRVKWAAAGTILAAAIAALVFIPAAFESSSSNGLFAYVRADTKGPLPACHEDGSNCGPANIVWHYIYVANLHPVGSGSGATRETLPNSYVVNSVTENLFVNGAPYTAFDGTATPPPSPSVRSWAGHWPMTVTCQPGAPPDPCNELHSPAVIPGENTSVLYAGWAHGDAEPNGSYVFRFTIHGTLNGNPLDLTADSPPIQMTG